MFQKVPSLLVFALGIVGLAVAGGLLAVGEESRRRGALDAARHENTTLRAEQQALRERAFDLAGRVLDVVARGQRMSRLAAKPGCAWECRDLRPPPPDVGDEALVSWLAEQRVRLQTLECEPAVGRTQVEIGGKQASVTGQEETACDAAVTPGGGDGSEVVSTYIRPCDRVENALTGGRPTC